MSLTSALQIARTGLVASQVGVQVAGNNLSNAATPGYTRQNLFLTPNRDQLSGSFSLGAGVGIRAVRRQIDEALQARLRESISVEQAAVQKRGILNQVESILGELSGFDLSSELSTFFNTWSDAANLTQSDATVVEQGQRLSAFIVGLRSDLSRQRVQIESQITERVRQADSVLTEIASLNSQIGGSEIGGAAANGLRDRRDELLGELATLVDIDTIEDDQGIVDVFVGSSPVVLAGVSLGLTVDRVSDGASTTVRIRTQRDGSVVPVGSGSIGGLLDSRDGVIDDVLGRLDRLTQRVIFEVNRVHATGSDSPGLTETFSQSRFPDADRALALNDPLNNTVLGLPVRPTNGSFLVNITNPTTGVSEQIAVPVDLDGIDGSLTFGATDDTSAQDIVSALDAIDGLNASFDPSGRIAITADPGFEFSFEDDSSGVLGALGINAFFTGASSGTIGVREDLAANPSKLTLGRLDNGQFVENGTALQIVALQERALADLGGVSISAYWQEAVQNVANEAGTAQTRADSGRVVRESLQAQRDSISGVSIDEESINLLTFQRQFQGAAQVITVANELLDTLISII